MSIITFSDSWGYETWRSVKRRGRLIFSKITKLTLYAVNKREQKIKDMEKKRPGLEYFHVVNHGREQ